MTRASCCYKKELCSFRLLLFIFALLFALFQVRFLPATFYTILVHNLFLIIYPLATIPG